MKISKRLRVISDYIPDNSFFLDVGCDHALLDIYTVLNKKNTKAIASDINEGPLKSAKENIEKYKVKDKVTIKCSNGLDSYEKGIDTVILSGLGAHTIINILKNRKDLLNNIDNLIISSNNDYYYLRNNITKLGYYINDEKMVFDKGKYYPIILFKKGSKKYSFYEFKYGPVFLKKKEKEFLDYIKHEKNKMLSIYNSLNFKHIFKKYKLKKNIKFIDKI